MSGLDFCRKHYMRLAPAMFSLMRHGVRIDLAKAAELRTLLTDRCDEIKTELAKQVGADHCTCGHNIDDHPKRLRNKWAGVLKKDGSPRKAKWLTVYPCSHTGERGVHANGCACLSFTPTHPALHGKKDISSQKVSKYLYGELSLPKQKVRNKGGLTANEVALRKLVLKCVAQEPQPKSLRRWKREPEFAQAVLKYILDHREQFKLLNYVDPSIFDVDGRLRSMYKVTTEPGRLASSSNPFGTGCVPGDTEVLTPWGWEQIRNITDGDLIASWDVYTKQITFTTVQHMTAYRNKGTMVAYDSWFHKAWYTHDHRMPLARYSDRTYRDYNAEDVPNSMMLLPVSGYYAGGTVTYDKAWLQLLVAIQADGSIEGNLCRIGFSKPRKIARFLKLCKKAGLHPHEGKPNAVSGQRRWGFSVAESLPFISVLTKAKCFGSWLLSLSQECLRTIVNEVGYWDGLWRGKSAQYFTTQPQSAEWISTAAHLVGWSSSVRVNYDNNNGFGSGNNLPLYTVALKPRSFITIEPKHRRLRGYNGMVYCPTVETSYFLARRMGSVFVTGNCNLQNIRRPGSEPYTHIRKIFLPDPGLIWFKVDYSQAEKRIVQALTKDPEYIRQARLRPLDFDSYTHAAKFVFSQILKCDPDEVDVKEEVVPGTNRRQLIKPIILGVPYGEGALRIQETLLKDGVVLKMKMCERLLDIACEQPILDYQSETRKRIWRDRQLVNSWGRRLDFTGCRLDSSTYRRGYAFRGASENADNLNQLGFIPAYHYCLDLEHGTRVQMQVHDEIAGSAHPDELYDFFSFLKESMERPRLYEGVELAIPVTYGLGINAMCAEDEGGVEWKELPSRREVEEKAWELWERCRVRDREQERGREKRKRRAA